MNFLHNPHEKILGKALRVMIMSNFALEEIKRLKSQLIGNYFINILYRVSFFILKFSW